jgi:hypothetical protein
MGAPLAFIANLSGPFRIAGSLHTGADICQAGWSAGAERSDGDRLIVVVTNRSYNLLETRDISILMADACHAATAVDHIRFRMGPLSVRWAPAEALTSG